MEYDDKLMLIKNKNNKYRLLIILNILLSIFLTLTGTVSILYLIMILYEIINLSFLECFILDILLPYIYSCCVNPLVKHIDVKSKNIKKEINILEKEYQIEQSIENFRIRFNQLSRDNQIKLLNYIKCNYLYMIKGFEDINSLNDNDILMLINNMNDVKLIDNIDKDYSKKRVL